MKLIKKNGKAIALLIGIAAILFLAVYGLIALINDLSDSDTESTSSPTKQPTASDSIESQAAKPTYTPVSTEKPTPVDREISVSLASDTLQITNHRENLSFTNRTGDNVLTVYIADSTCSKTGYFETNGFEMADGYSVREEGNGVLVTVNVKKEFNLTEEYDEENYMLSIIPQLNSGILEYRNDLSRTYMIIQKARLCSESDSFIKNYTEIYDDVNMVFTLTISKSRMPEIKDELLLLNDGVIKTIEFINRSSDIQILVSVYEKIVIYPNTRDYDAAFTFIENKPSGGPLIVLDPGHGGIDGGTSNEDKSILEKNIVLKMGLMLADLLKEEGFNVLNLREEDIFLGLMERTDIANLAKADAIISVHCNAYTVEHVNGATTMYKTSSELASFIQDSLVSVTGANSLGTVKFMDMSILNRAEMDSVIVETGFLTNNAEAELLNSTEYQEKVAQGIAEGIINYFKGE